MSFKAFEQVLITDNIFRDKTKISIECIEAHDEVLWVGSSDGFIRQYELQFDEARADGSCNVQARLIFQQQIRQKPVQKILVLPPHLLLVLIDSKLVLLRSKDLLEIENRFLKKVENVRLLCRDMSVGAVRTFEVSYTVAKKGIFNIDVFFDETSQEFVVRQSENFKHIELPPKEQTADVLAISRDGYFLCMALQVGSVGVRYVLYHLTTAPGKENWIELCEYNSDRIAPLVMRVGPGEFLLKFSTEGSHTIGVFSSTRGATTRRHLEWPEPPSALAFHAPYVVAYCAGTQMLAIHSLLDQQQKQAILCNEGFRGINDTDTEIYLFTACGLTLLRSVSYESQIEQLLRDPRSVAEALQLAHVAYGGRSEGNLSEMHKKQYVAVLCHAGVIQLSAAMFAEGLDCFARSSVSPRVVISLFPGLPLKAPLRDDHMLSPPQVATIQAALKTHVTDPNKRVSAYKALEQYLLKYRGDPQIQCVLTIADRADHGRDVVDTAIVMCLALTSPEKLAVFLSEPNKCMAIDAAPVLQERGCHHAHALLLSQARMHDKALDLWNNLELGTLKDSSYPGIGFVVDYLTKLSEPRLVCQHAGDWILKRQPTAVTIFTKRRPDEKKDLFNPDEVFNILKPYDDALETYLAFLVFELKVEDERFHTRLALAYLDRLRKLGPNAPNELRWRLRSHLQSGRYDVKLIRDQIAETDLYAECAILYGKMGDHQKALDIFVHTLKDLSAAEQYCDEYTRGKDRASRCALYQSLLSVYLSHRGEPAYAQRAVDLLNSHKSELDPAQVLKILPDTWTIQYVHPFLRRSLHHTLHLERTTRIQHGLARSYAVNTHKEHLDLSSRSIRITDESRCQVCEGRLMEAPFARYPNGVLVHEKCCKEREICPVTGKDFSRET